MTSKRTKGIPASEAIKLQPPKTFQSAADYFPARKTLTSLATASKGCRACDLWRTGTQTVFGEGRARASIVLVGEQPGDQEDKQDRPFVGPAGRLLDDALNAAGIDREEVYLTNVVKHFRWERGEKSERRIHKKPNDAEVRACYPWLGVELAAIKPAVVVALGATAAQAIMGKQFRVTRDRGKLLKTGHGYALVATMHPSSVLRAPSSEARRIGTEDLIRDLTVAARAVR